MQIYLETERLILRRFTPDDVDNLCALDGDPMVMHYLTGGATTPRIVIEQEVLPRFLSFYEQFTGYGFWAAVEKASGAFLGWFHFRPGQGAAPGEVELGYRLVQAVWGQGYGTEGSRALIDKGFAELGVRRVVASTFEHNLASRRVMEKAGLRLVRRFRIDPADVYDEAVYGPTPPALFDGDDVEYALEREEWERRQPEDAAGG